MGFTGAPLYRQMVIDLARLGVTTNVGMVLAAVLMHESADGTSNVARSCNNYGGITFVKQAGATPCTRSQPGNEGGARYAAYPDLTTFLKDFLRIMRLNRAGRGAPLSALKAVELLNEQTGKPYTVYMLDVPEMVARMRANGYFSDSESNYLAGVQRKFKQYAEPELKEIYQAQQNERLAKGDGAKKYGPDTTFTEALTRAWEEDIEKPVKDAFGAAGKYVLWGTAGLVVLILITRR